MKKILLTLAAIAVVGGSALALAHRAGAQDGDTNVCDPSDCRPCPGCCCG